ncbi:hypothetical protein [Streptomyces sp. NRRL S-340]|uniref:hypothetical protein n=1 Tax=Streptomyces sp. NRRL S-340 TaxID=1463901 RepID=UPI00131BDC7E|nr:hypothetical protein [Streptomyces sp. NRRL S-340]
MIRMSRAVSLHSAVTDNRDFDSVTTSVRDEFSFYTAAFTERLRAQDSGLRTQDSGLRTQD